MGHDFAARTQAERALREAEEFATRLIACSRDCIKVLDLEGRLQWMNEGGMQALEICELAPFQNASWIDFWEGADRAAAKAAVESAAQGETGRFTGFFRTTRTHQPRWWDVVVSPISNAAGKPERLLAVSRDVTDRKQSEEDLQQAHENIARSEERWRSVFTNSAIGVALTDLQGRFFATNPVYQEMVGYSHAELETISFLELTHPDDREANWALAIELLEGKRQQFQVEKRYRRKDGSLIWVSNNVSLVPGTESMSRFIMALSEDVTLRKETEEALHQSESRFRLILDSTAEGIFGCDAEGTCLFCNRAALRLLGFAEPSELLGQNMHALEHHSHADGTPYPIEDCPIYNGFLRGEGVHRDDDVFWHKDGTAFPVEYWSHPIVREEKTIGAVVTFVDITERKNAEEALRKGEQRKRSLLRINNAIVTNLTKEAFQPAIWGALREYLPFDGALLTLYHEDRGSLRVAAMDTHLSIGFVGVGSEMAMDSHHGWVFDNQQPLLRRDVQSESLYPMDRRLLETGLKSFGIVPLIVEGKAIGTLGISSCTAGAYSQEDVDFLSEAAGQVALAAANMKLYEEINGLKARLEQENVYLREEVRTEHNFEEIVGSSPSLMAVLHAVEQVAPTDSTVLILGETGTGKELIARAIHNRSARRERALVTVNCSAISAGLVESELFGHKKGAFTGAIEQRIGRFELANDGTIFLDEIGELPLETQVKLLRVLQEQEFEAVGSSRPVRVDVRVIAATNRDLLREVESGRFRSDLFYRLNVFPVQMPPLRERGSDIPQLVGLFLSRFAKRLGKKIDGVSKETMTRLMEYSWPGNIRELQNVIERAVVMSSGPNLHLDQHLIPLPSKKTRAAIAAQDDQPARAAPAQSASLDDVERDHIASVLQQTRGVIDGPKGAAQILKIHPNTLRHRMGRLGIRPQDHRRP
jgi:formate hydrogenlyase transcriptional activator